MTDAFRRTATGLRKLPSKRPSKPWSTQRRPGAMKWILSKRTSRCIAYPVLSCPIPVLSCLVFSLVFLLSSCVYIFWCLYLLAVSNRNRNCYRNRNPNPNLTVTLTLTPTLTLTLFFSYWVKKSRTWPMLTERFQALWRRSLTCWVTSRSTVPPAIFGLWPRSCLVLSFVSSKYLV